MIDEVSDGHTAMGVSFWFFFLGQSMLFRTIGYIQ